MTKEQYEKLKEYIVATSIMAAAVATKFRVDDAQDMMGTKQKELDKLMGFDSTHPMEPNRYKD